MAPGIFHNWKRKPNREEPGGMSEPPGGASGESVEGIPEATDPILTG